MVELIKDISKFKDMVLATSCNDIVSARTVSTIVSNNKIYFQTANTMEKYKQLSNNCNVALTKGFYQIEGVARAVGTWEQNAELCELYKAVHLNSYNSYGTLPEEEVIEVTITRIKLWSYEDDGVYLIEYIGSSESVSKTKQSMC